MFWTLVGIEPTKQPPDRVTKQNIETMQPKQTQAKQMEPKQTQAKQVTNAK